MYKYRNIILNIKYSQIKISTHELIHKHIIIFELEL